MRRVLSILLLLACAASAQSIDPRMTMLLDTGWRGLFDKSGVVAAYDFDDGAGTDLGEGARNLTTVGGVTFSAGRFGLAPFFDTGGQMLTNSMTVATIYGAAFWFNLTNTLSASSRDQYPVVLSTGGAGTLIGFGATTGLMTGELIAWWDQSGALRRSVIVSGNEQNPVSLPSGWHHIVIARETSSETFSAWLDGVRVAVSDNAGGTTNLSGNILSVGDYPGNNNPIDGQIDDLLLLSRPITHLEAMSLYWWRPE